MDRAPQSYGGRSRRPPKPAKVPAPAWHAVSRGVSLFLGCGLLLNLIGEMRWGGFDSNFWWLDLRPISPEIGRGVLGACGTLFVIYAFYPQISGLIRGLTLAAILLLAGGAAWKAYQFYEALRAGELHTDLSLPFAIELAALLMVVFAGVIETPRKSDHTARDILMMTLAVSACLAGLPVALMFCDGMVERSEQENAVVVFAAFDQFDRPSNESLQGRLKTVGELYSNGRASKIILCSGPGASERDAQALRESVLAEGIPDQDILVIPPTKELRESVSQIVARCAEFQWPRVLVVGPFYQLPRARVMFRREGFEARTMPSEEDEPRVSTPFRLAREGVLLWQFYLSPAVEAVAEARSEPSA